jgi:hypothetical protein
MRLKNKTIFGITVKLLFAASLLHAQSPRDSATQKLIQFYPASNSTLRLVKYPVIAPNLYAKQLPFFCNKELQIQKTTGIALKFRLSTVEYCDKLEGKNR